MRIEFCFRENDAEFREKNIKICENFKKNCKKNPFSYKSVSGKKKNFPKLAKFSIFLAK